MKKLQTITKATITIMVILFNGIGLAAAQISAPVVGQVTGGVKAVIERIGVWALGIAGAIAVIFLIYGGIMYITGGEKGAESGKKIIVNAIIGLAVIALASLIAKAVLTAIGGGIT